MIFRFLIYCRWRIEWQPIQINNNRYFKPDYSLSIKQLLFFFALSTALHAAPPKEALLIANGKYSHFAGLAHPEPDAAKLSAALYQLGFRVRVVRDGNREEMLEAISEFERGLRNTGAIAFFHYGGHGVQVDGKNYLLPADADIPDERRVATRALALDEVMAAMEAAAARASIIVIDACRDNPLPAGSGRNLARGLSVVGIKPKNSIVIYAAEAGSKALDGLFTPILASSLLQKGRTIDQVLKVVRREVHARSQGRQIPGEYNQLFDEIILSDSNPTSAAAIAPLDPAPIPRVTAKFTPREKISPIETETRNDSGYNKKNQIFQDSPSKFTSNLPATNNSSADCLSILPENFRDSVVDMASDYGSPDPQNWFVTIKSSTGSFGLRYLQIRHGRVVSNDPFSFFSNIFYSHYPLEMNNVKIDSRSAYEIAKNRAAARGFEISQATFLLRSKGKLREPVWLLWCWYDNTCLGAIEVHARNGEILSAKGKFK